MTSTWARALRIGVVVAMAALVMVLILAFRRDPHDIRTGTVGKPAPCSACSGSTPTAR